MVLSTALIAVPVISGVYTGITAIFNKHIGTSTRLVAGATAVTAAIGATATSTLLSSGGHGGAEFATFVLAAVFDTAALVGTLYCLGAARAAKRAARTDPQPS